MNIQSEVWNINIKVNFKSKYLFSLFQAINVKNDRTGVAEAMDVKKVSMNCIAGNTRPYRYWPNYWLVRL